VIDVMDILQESAQKIDSERTMELLIFTHSAKDTIFMKFIRSAIEKGVCRILRREENYCSASIARAKK